MEKSTTIKGAAMTRKKENNGTASIIALSACDDASLETIACS